MVDLILIILSIFLVFSVTASKISDRFGIPSLLLFLILGMLAGSEGIGGIYFDNPIVAQSIGLFALMIILFSGGLDTEWEKVKPVLKPAITLSTLGVLLTSLTLGIAAKYLLKVSLLEGLLIGAITSSTDAAAVFALLRAKGVKLKNRISALLELESGSNDPMAVFLTLGIIQIIQNEEFLFFQLVAFFLQQMVIGAVIGGIAGILIITIVKRIRLGYEGLYSVLVLGLVMMTFGLTNKLGGSGFLAVYIAGLIMGSHQFENKHRICHFFDGMAWLMQVCMFLTLGLFVFPSELIPIAIPAIFLALLLMIIARPLSVIICMFPYEFNNLEKLFVSWVGLRGAVPIILALYPKIEQMENGNRIFNLVFFVVLLSVLLQGTTLPSTAKLFKVEAP